MYLKPLEPKIAPEISKLEMQFEQVSLSTMSLSRNVALLI